MKRLILIIAVIGCSACFGDSLITVHAQTLPATKTLLWDANATSEQVTNYTVTLDNVVVGNPTGTSQVITFTTAGPHVLKLTATNLWGTGPASTLSVNVVVPTGPSNMRLP